MILHPNIKYRSDIDGLRALAVLSVILYHINEEWIPGGFLGVDIFFVISGYLITLILIKEVELTNKINIVNFYKRRIKRIIPALLFVLIPTFIIGFLLFTPSDLLALSKSMIWSFFSAANIYFFSSIDTGYFATGSSEIPLLHLWSLGVEEQFYILWPFVVLFLLRYISSSKKKLILVGVLFVSSLIWAQLTIVSNHSFAYYLLPTRSWELFAGSFAALLVHSGLQTKKLVNELMALIGLVAIILSLIFISESDPVPGTASLPAILGSTLLILSGVKQKTYIGRILSLKIFVAIGLVSYSAYLWHWPILAFLRYSLIDIDLTVSILVIIITFILATISYFFIESPLRRNDTSTRKVFLFYFIIPTLVIVSSSVIIQQAIKHKSDWIYPWEALDVIKSNILPSSSNSSSCHFKNSLTIYNQKHCIYPENIAKANVFLIGDSNAAHYLEMLKVIANNRGFSIRNATRYACPLIFNGEIDWIAVNKRKGCSLYRHTVFNEAIKYDTVIIGLSWNYYYAKKGFKERFKESILRLSKNVKNIIILGKIPVFSTYDKECESKEIRISHLNCSDRFDNLQKVTNHNKYLQGIALNHKNIEYMDIDNQVCKEGICSPYLDGEPVYYDGGHLSIRGSRIIGQKMIENNDSMLHVFKHLKNMKQNYISPVVTIDTDKDSVTCIINPKKANVLVAFYLYKDDKRIDTQWYSSDFSYKIDKKKYGKGKYRIRYFVISANSSNPSKAKKLISGYSKYIILKNNYEL
ncbi:MAG TPA: acyltransferase [Arcobacter sp.]|nr:acyltransferase [Arcobacter sp.]